LGKNIKPAVREEHKHMAYSAKVMDHFANPRNTGELKDANAIGEVGNPVCGDIMKMYLRINNEIIEDVKFKTFGCGAAVATSSIATEMIKGKTITQALALSNKAVIEALDGLPPAKIHCSVLAEQAVKSAISDYYRRKGIDPVPIVGKLTDCDACHLHKE
jgi:nitrogen fixation NifU-like protein